MKVQRLTLRNFRNVQECGFEPDPHLNLLVGANGQGKTSFLEALAYLATLRSFRGAKTDEVIRWGDSAGEAVCALRPDDDSKGDWESELKVVFAAGPQKTSKVAFINGKPYRSSTQYLSQRFGSFELGFHAVVFNPSDHDLVRGEPALRRQYLDRVISAEDLDYLKVLTKYHRVLEQRNALLKSDERPSRSLLLGFSEPLAKYGAEIVDKRLAWFERLRVRLNDTAQQIAPKQPFLRAIYVSGWVPKTDDLSIPNNDLNPGHFTGQGFRPSLEILEQSFWTKLSNLEEAELRARSSLVGPHRDDWTFFLGNQVLKGHGSQGEVRSALLALKLSEIGLFRERTGHRPILLLDDFSSELDRERRSFLLRFLTETDLQVFITTTEDSVSWSKPVGKRFQVENGMLRALESSKESLNDHSATE